MRSVYYRIRSFVLKTYHPHFVLPLTPAHKRQRLEWCRERSGWDKEWNTVAFSDELRFCLSMHDGRMLVRRRRRERRNPQFAVERHVHRTVGLMVWGCIAYGSRSTLVFIRGSTTSPRYVEEVVEPYLLHFLRTQLGLGFQQDNARPHIARNTFNFFEEYEVELLPWPPRSPNLSPIEHVRDMIGRRLTHLQRPPQTLNDLKREV